MRCNDIFQDKLKLFYIDVETVNNFWLRKSIVYLRPNNFFKLKLYSFQKFEKKKKKHCFFLLKFCFSGKTTIKYQIRKRTQIRKKKKDFSSNSSSIF